MSEYPEDAIKRKESDNMTTLPVYIIGILIGINIGSAITRLIYEFTNEKKGGDK